MDTNASHPYSFPPGLRMNLALYAVNRFRSGDPIQLFQYLADTFGDAAHYRLGPNDIVFLNHPDYIREVLVVQNSRFIKERTVQRMKMLVGEGLITAEGATHRRQRAIAQPAFHRSRIAGYAETMVEKAVRMRAGWRPGQELDMAREMMHVTLAVAAKALFGTDIAAEVEEMAHEVNAIMRLYNFLVILPYAERLVWLPLPGLWRFRKARKHLDRIVSRMVAEHRHSGTDSGDLLSMLVAARFEDGSAMNDEQLRDQIMTILLAGYETTANALTWTWYLLSQNPEAERRLHDEVDEVLAGRAPTVDDLPRLRYAEMVLAESMRLYPPAWAQGRRAIEDFQLGAYFMPKGTTVFMSQWVSHRDKRWFEDPLEFRPERFSKEGKAGEGKAGEAKAGRQRLAYFPFGAGPRQCIGEAFAWMEATLVLVTTAQRWRFRLLPGQAVKPQPLITLRPRHGMRMTAEERRI